MAGLSIYNPKYQPTSVARRQIVHSGLGHAFCGKASIKENESNAIGTLGILTFYTCGLQ